ncbi:MAG: hypothetical protein LBH11_02865 [Propionibacteriaceae bacterium]|nr:hypothetical protein [Propionibacteriaceae bacterium]
MVSLRLSALGVLLVFGGLYAFNATLRNQGGKSLNPVIFVVTLGLGVAFMVASITGFIVSRRTPDYSSLPSPVQAKNPVKECGDGPIWHQEDGLTIRYQRLDVQYFGPALATSEYPATISVTLCIDNSSSSFIELRGNTATSSIITYGENYGAYSFPAMSRGLAAYKLQFSGLPAEPLQFDWLSLTLHLHNETLGTKRILGPFDVPLSTPLLISPPRYDPPSVTPQVILDTPELTLTVIGLTIQEYSVELKVRVENRTGEPGDILPSIFEEGSISGLSAMLGHTEITAAPESQVVLSVTPRYSADPWVTPTLERITDIAFTFDAMFGIRSSGLSLSHNQVYIQTSHFGQTETHYTVSGDELFRNESFSVTGTGASIHVGGELDVYLMFENRSSNFIWFTLCTWDGTGCAPPTDFIRSESGIAIVNGCAVEATLLYNALSPNTIGFDDVLFNPDALSSCGISHYTTVDFAVRAIDPISGEVLFETPLLSYGVS